MIHRNEDSIEPLIGQERSVNPPPTSHVRMYRHKAGIKSLECESQARAQEEVSLPCNIVYCQAIE